MEKQIVVPLDDFGQPGRSITMRNPAAMSYRQVTGLRDTAGEDGGLAVLLQLIVSWDALDADGAPLPSLDQKPDALEDLPIAVLGHVLRVMGERLEISVPKGSATPSTTSSDTPRA